MRDSIVQDSGKAAQPERQFKIDSPGDPWGKIASVVKVRNAIKKAKRIGESVEAVDRAKRRVKADREALTAQQCGPVRSQRRKWDSLDIEMAADALLEGFVLEFYGVAWDQLSNKDAKRVLGAFSSHYIAMGRACSPIPYELTDLGKELVKEAVRP